MAKNYGLKFGTAVLTSTSGLAPTFTHFCRLDNGSTLAPPGITQIFSGVGIYSFEYTPSFPIYFEVDGATTGLGSNRYIHGMLDNVDQIDVLVGQMGTTLISGITGILNSTGSLSIGVSTLLSAVGSVSSAFGDNVTDPSTLYGYLKRIQENLEGDSIYTKDTGVWAISARGGDTLIASKTLTDSASTVTKS